MGAKRLETRKLPSRQVTERAARVPHRSCQAARAGGGGACERLTVAISQRAPGAGRADREASTGRSRIGRASRPNLENVKFKIDQKVVHLVSDPISAMGGAVGLQGSLAPAGAMAKVAEMTELPFPEPAWAFDGKDLQAVAKRGDADLCIGGQRPKRRRLMGAVAVRLDLYVCEADVVRWREVWKAPVNPHQSGVLRTYADQVEPARKGAVSPCGWEGESCR
jgi:Dehydratase family